MTPLARHADNAECASRHAQPACHTQRILPAAPAQGPRLAACVLVAALTFACYSATLLPGVDFGDTAAYQSAVGDWRLTPRQAYPLYYAIANTVFAVTGGEPAHSLNLTSALAGGGCLRRDCVGGVSAHRVGAGRGLGRTAAGRVLHLLVAGHHRRGLHAARAACLPGARRGAVVAPAAVAAATGGALLPLCAGLRQPLDDGAAGAGADCPHHRHARRPSAGAFRPRAGPGGRVRGARRLAIRLERRVSLAGCRPRAVAGRGHPHVLVRRHQVGLALDDGDGRPRDGVEASRRPVLFRSPAAGWPRGNRRWHWSAWLRSGVDGGCWSCWSSGT